VGSPTAIRVEGVSKRFRLYKDRPTTLKERVTQLRQPRYDEFWALRDISLEVPSGSAFGLVGRNGSGKSTLLRVMARIHRPNGGSVETRGRVSALLDLGAGFHPELSGRENVYLNGAILGLNKRQINDVFAEIVEFSGLGEFIDSPVKVYSSGMYVRLGFSVAVHVRPDILMIDEVIAVGDEEFQRRCFDHLYGLRRQGVTVVFVSHDLGLMASMCDRVAWLDHGQLLAEGPALEVTRQYLDQVNEAEEERIGESETNAGPGHRRGTREVEVRDLEFLDSCGQPVAVAGTGDTLVIRIHYDAHTAVEEPVFGLAFHSEGGVHLAGPNTRLSGLSTGTLRGQGYLDYRIERLALMPGLIRITVGVFDKHIMHAYDYRDQSFSLHVQLGSSVEQFGIVDLGGTWKPLVPTPAGGLTR
jgi:ABC-type polysaccharide/polyol phosphate transport system ATPase subunit